MEVYESLYHRIQTRPLSLGEKELAQIFEQVRFDPRLMEVATEFIRDFWWNINPKLFNKALKKIRFPYAVKPAALAVLMNSLFTSDSTKSDFLDWYKDVMVGIKNPEPQLFYIGLNKIGGKSMRREEAEAIPCFIKFNLLAKDIPFNKGNPGVVKTKESLAGVRLDSYSLAKNEIAARIKSFKLNQRLTNDDVTRLLGINRSFLSKILNNDLDGISVDYLMKKDLLVSKLLVKNTLNI